MFISGSFVGCWLVMNSMSFVVRSVRDTYETRPRKVRNTFAPLSIKPFAVSRTAKVVMYSGSLVPVRIGASQLRW